MENKAIIKAMINQWDPLHLFPCAPEDEYSVEIEKISLSIGSTCSAKELAEQIQSIFQQAFGQEFDYIKCLMQQVKFGWGLKINLVCRVKAITIKRTSVNKCLSFSCLQKSLVFFCYSRIDIV